MAVPRSGHGGVDSDLKPSYEIANLSLKSFCKQLGQNANSMFESFDASRNIAKVQ